MKIKYKSKQLKCIIKRPTRGFLIENEIKREINGYGKQDNDICPYCNRKWKEHE